jgi:glucose/arabinose dehydrogenase
VNRVFISGLRQPFGIAFGKGHLYIGNTDEVVRVPYEPGQLSSTARPQHITSLPGGGYNQHWTRNLLIDPRRGKLYVTVGSRTNASPEPPPRASILEMNLDGTERRVLASGLRNPVGLALNPGSHQLWAAVNERDRLGDDVPPDYLTSIRPGGFYGWPYAYLGTHPDPRWGPIRPDRVRSGLMPDVPLPAHSAALGLLFYTGSQFPAAYRGDVYVALHGSWNQRQRSGYRVTRVHFSGGRPVGAPQDFLVGWATSEGEVWGRPVGLAQLKDGSLVVSDDGANKLWRVSYLR